MINIVYFSSGDFGIPSLIKLLDKGNGQTDISIKGIVTSKDKTLFHPKKISDIAEENEIPYIIPKNEEELMKFLTSLGSIDMFCVISYKKLSPNILSLVNGNAINIHASLLPFLRGAAPISWAIRIGFKQTGLTAFKLSDKIDSGDIIATTAVDIEKDENYQSLFKRLSDICADNFITTVIEYYMKSISDDNVCFLHQPSVGVKSRLLMAPKINRTYWLGWKDLDNNEIDRLFKSTMKGLPCKLYAINRDDIRETYEFQAKIWDYEWLSYEDAEKHTLDLYPTECDGKNYLRIPTGQHGTMLMSIKKFQLEGKKIMPITDFLRGFKYSRKIDQFYLDITSY